MKEVADLNDTLRREGEEAARKRGDHARRFHSNGGDQQAASERPVDAHAYAGYSGTAADKPNGKQLVVQRASDITPEAVDWLWSGRLAAGKTTLVGGDPGLGKSQLAISIAATITRGGQWPCGEGAAPKCSVIILCAEDGAADTVVPRLMAAGADRDKIHIVTAVHEADGKGRRLFNLSKDLDILERLINKIGDVGLVTIDPVDAYIGADVDGHKNTAVRAVLEPISEMADRRRVAILAVTHFSKQSGSKALYRFIGSIAHIGSARVAFTVMSDLENEGRILVLNAKNNLAPMQKGLAFRLEQHIVADGIIASSVCFDSEHVSQTADQALAAENGTREQATAKGDTDEFLREVLAAGPVAVWEIQDEARSAGMLGPTQPISQSKPFRSARMALGIVPSKRGMSDGWVWELPKMPSGSEDAFQKERAPSKIEGTFGSPSRVLAGDGPRDVCARSTRHYDNYPELPAILDRRGQP